MFGRSLVEKRGIGGISAYAVVMSVSGHKSAVESDVFRLERGDEGELRAQKVLFLYPVFFAENPKQVFLDGAVFFVLCGGIGNISQPDVEIFPAQTFTERFCILFCREMRK